MNRTEYRLIAKVMLTADGGCSQCAGNLLDQLEKLYPEYRKTSQRLYRKRFPVYVITKVDRKAKAITMEEMRKVLHKSKTKLLKAIKLANSAYYEFQRRGKIKPLKSGQTISIPVSLAFGKKKKKNVRRS